MSTEKKEEASLRFRFAHNLRIQRVKAGLSQEELAVCAGLHRTFVSDVERGVRSLALDNIEKLAKALPVDPVELFRPLESGSDKLPDPLPKGPKKNRKSA